MLSDLIYRLRTLFRRRRAESELDDEIRFHLEREIEKHRAAGASVEEATRRASLAFGGASQTAEACRDARGTASLEAVWKDFRHAVRTLRASPLFAITVIVSLALGIGANTAVFTLLRASLWKPLAIENPQEFFYVQRNNPSTPGSSDAGVSYVLFEQLRKTAEPFGPIAAKSGFGLQKFGTDADSRERAVGEGVTANYFDVLRVRPLVGRLFEATDDSLIGGKRVAVLSHRFWSRRFQSDPSILGRTIFYKESPYVVVGVSQAHFDGVEAEALVDVWVPATADVPPKWLGEAHVSWLRLLARIPAASNPHSAQAALETRFRTHLEQELLPHVSPRFRPSVEGQRLTLRPASAGISTTGRKYERPLLILMTVVGFVLLISCANVTNLVLARNRFREGELAVRRALGASRSRIVSQLFAESLLLALIGTAGGLLLAPWTCRLLLNLLPRTPIPLAFDLSPDPAVLAFTVALGLLTAAIAGMLPALGASRVGATLTLRTGSRATGHTRIGKLLVAGQLALCLLLLIGAGLFLDTLRRLKSIDLGFQPEQVIAFHLSFPKGVPPEQVLRTHEQVRVQLQSSPGVVAATYANPGVYGSGGWSLGVYPEGYAAPQGEDNEAGMIATGPGFLETIRLPLLQGRYFDVQDLSNSPPVAVVNERFARRYFGNESAVGRRIRVPGDPVVIREIVGVVRDARHYGAKEQPWRMVYVPASRDGSFAVRTTGNLQASSALIRSVVASTSGAATVESITTLDDSINAMVSRERLIAALSSAFAVLAVLLASVGLYGVIAYGVSRRTAELGIRMALGAQQSEVQWLVLRETIQLVAAGGAIGLLASLALTRFVSSMLYEVQATDPRIFALAALLLAAVAGIAGFLPARRASRIDPMIALRYE